MDACAATGSSPSTRRVSSICTTARFPLFHDELVRATEPDRAQLLAAPIIQAALRGEVTRGQYIDFLTQAYHHVRHTVPLLMGCGARLPERHAWLQRALADYIQEEAGHDDWILSDIDCAGA